MISSGRKWLRSVLPIGLFLSAPMAPRQRPVPVQTMLDVRIIEESPITFSHNGRWVAYVMRNSLPKASSYPWNFDGLYMCTGLYPDSLNTDIGVSNVLTGETVRVGGGIGNNWLPSWSPDGRHLAFLSDRDGSGQAKLWIWDVETKDLRKLSDIDVRANQIEWAGRGDRIYTTVWNGTASPENLASCRGAKPSGNNPPAGTPESPSVVVYQWPDRKSSEQGKPSGDPWSLGTKLRDLAEFDMRTGRMRRLTHGYRISIFRVSPDGSRIVFTVPTRFERPGSQQILFDLVDLELESAEIRKLASSVRLDLSGRTFSWSPDSESLVFQEGGPLDTTGDCFTVGLNGRVIRNLTSLPPQEGYSTEFPPLWDVRREQVYFLRNQSVWRASIQGGSASELAKIPDRRIVELLHGSDGLKGPLGAARSLIVLTEDPAGGQSGYYSIDLETGKSRKLLERGEHYEGASLESAPDGSAGEDRVVYLSQSAEQPPDLWTSDALFHQTRRLTHVNPELDRYQMGSAKLIHWNSLDGERLSGALLLPPNYDREKKLPLIVLVYGGALESTDRDVFGLLGLGGPYNMQLFATRGFAVLAPDAPLRLGTPMLDLAKTILPGVDKTVAMGVADANRIGVMGHSYGGYSVLGLIVQSDRFKAAMMSDGFGDLVSAYGQMDAQGSSFQTAITERGQGLMGGTPWEFRDRYIENSPIFYLDRVKIPLMIVHGGADAVVAPFLGDQVFVACRRLGVDVVYAKYLREGHYPGMWSRQDQTDLASRMIAWFGEFLNK